MEQRMEYFLAILFTPLERNYTSDYDNSSSSQKTLDSTALKTAGFRVRNQGSTHVRRECLDWLAILASAMSQKFEPFVLHSFVLG
jgi:hypothetical protein